VNRYRWYGFTVDVALSFEKGPNGPRPLHDPGPLYRPVRRVEGRHAVRYALVGLHWILRAAWWWTWHRYVIEEYFFAIGWMEGDHPEAPALRSLRFGDPLRILEERVERIRATYRDARDYAIRRAHEEGYVAGARMTAEQLEELRKLVHSHHETAQAYRAHAASFGALQEISMLTDLEGEVAEYSDVVAAVKRALARTHREGVDAALAIADAENEGMPARATA